MSKATVLWQTKESSKIIDTVYDIPLHITANFAVFAEKKLINT